MSALCIEFTDKSSGESKYIGIGPSNSLVAFLSGGGIHYYDKKSSSDISISISEILDADECNYVFPLYRPENFNHSLSEGEIKNHSKYKKPTQLWNIFKKIDLYYTKKLYSNSLDDSIPTLWSQENLKDTLWDYGYIREILSCLEVCKNITSEVKYYCY